MRFWRVFSLALNGSNELLSIAGKKTVMGLTSEHVFFSFPQKPKSSKVWLQLIAFLMNLKSAISNSEFSELEVLTWFFWITNQ